jgi:hypothetical protein
MAATGLAPILRCQVVALRLSQRLDVLSNAGATWLSPRRTLVMVEEIVSSILENLTFIALPIERCHASL